MPVIETNSGFPMDVPDKDSDKATEKRLSSKELVRKAVLSFFQPLRDLMKRKEGPNEIKHSGTVVGIGQNSMQYRDGYAMIGIGLETVRQLTGLTDDQILLQKDKTVTVTTDLSNRVTMITFEE